MPALAARKMCKEWLTPAVHLRTRAFGQTARQPGEDMFQRPMLHLSNAGSPLWQKRGSCEEAAGQSRRGRGRRRGAGTWRRALASPVRKPPEGREDLPGSLRLAPLALGDEACSQFHKPGVVRVALDR